MDFTQEKFLMLISILVHMHEKTRSNLPHLRTFRIQRSP